MSEDTRNPESGRNVNNDNIKDLKVDISGASFEPILDSKFMFARDFGEIVSKIFREVFVDWEGCRVVDIQVNNVPFIALEFYFNHHEYPEGDKFHAITRNPENGKQTNNPTLNGIRRFSNAMINGDRYYLTEEAKAIFSHYLFDMRGLYGQHGKINWNSCVSEAAEPIQNYSQMYGQMPVQQYTALSKIDPSKIATAIYGDTNDDADWCYQVVPVLSMPIMSQYGVTNNTDPANRIIRIDRVSAKELNELAKKLGFSNFGNKLNIIR
jgi:hypothetical protein